MQNKQIRCEEALTQFIYHVSHDMRTPIKQTKQLFELFISQLDSELTTSQRELKTQIETAIDSSCAQLDGLLILSRLDNASSTESFEIQALLDEVINSINHDQKQGIDIIVECHANKTVHTIKNNVYIACFEVISNALKFRNTDDLSSIQIHVNQNMKWLTIAIKDQGIGIASNQADEIYAPFQRLVLQKHYPGIGMGLTLAKRALELINGRIEMIQNEDQGVTFLLHISLKPSLL